MDEISLPINSDVDIFAARQKGRVLAKELGVSPVEVTLLAATISELARDILMHAKSGEITLKRIQEQGKAGIMITATYDAESLTLGTRRAGPHCDATSSWSPIVQQQVRCLVDEMEIYMAAGGEPTVTAIKWRP